MTWSFMWTYGNLLGTSSWLLSTWYYMDQLVNSVKPTIDFMYDNFLTNPIIIWLILVLLVLSLFTFGD